MATLHFTPVHQDTNVFSIANKALKLTSADDIKPYLDDLSKSERITKLDFSGNTIGIEASSALSKFIADHDSVKLNVTEINFADLYTSRLVDEVVNSLNLLLPVLLKCPKLEILNLSDNAFGLRTIDILERYISNAVNLKHLILSNNGMGPFAGERIGKALFQLAEKKKKEGKPFLETFICGRNRLENGSAACLALGLKNHGQGLKVVKLYQNGIRPKGVATLIKYGLKYNTGLEVVDLQDNTFTTSASLILAETLPEWKNSLVELNVNDCLLKGKGSDAVIRVLRENDFSALENLKLQYNEITQETLVNELLPALKDDKLPSLKSLELNGNRFEEDSEPLETLQEIFAGELDELDDLEEVDSEEEEEEEEESEEEDAEELEEIDLETLEKGMLESQIEDLAEELEKTHI